MLKLTATNAIVSKGYNDAPAVQLSETGSVARFRIGIRIYDKQTDGNYRYVNLTVKAFGNLVKRISDMGIKAGSIVNLIGRFDEESWTDQKTKEAKKGYVVILDEIEFASGKAPEESHSGSTGSENNPGDDGKTGFTGYEPFGSSYFDE